MGPTRCPVTKLIAFPPSMLPPLALQVPFVPVSALLGEGLSDAPRQMPWHSGGAASAPASVVAALDAVEAPKRASDKPLRLTVQVCSQLCGDSPR